MDSTTEHENTGCDPKGFGWQHLFVLALIVIALSVTFFIVTMTDDQASYPLNPTTQETRSR